MGHTEATTSWSPASPLGSYNRGNDLFISLSLSLSLTVHSYAQSQNIQNFTTTPNRFALSHIYTHMNFGLFTHIATGGSLEHIHISVPSNRSGRLPPGLQSSDSYHVPSGGTCFPTGTTRAGGRRNDVGSGRNWCWACTWLAYVSGTNVVGRRRGF